MSATDILLRPAEPRDREALGRLGALLVARHHEFDAARFFAPGPQTAKGYGSFLASQLDRPEVVVLAAEAEGEVVGYAYGALEDADWMVLRGPAGAIYDLVVEPARQGQGIGRRLLEALAARLVEMGAPQLVLQAAERNERARRLFASAGFRPTMVEMTREA